VEPLIWALLGLGGAVGALPLAWVYGRRLRQPRGHWGLGDAGLAIALLVGASIGLGALFHVGAGGSFGGGGEPPLGPAVLASVLAGLLAAGFALGRAGARGIGLVPCSPRALLLATLLVLPVLGATAAWSALLSALGLPAEDQALVALVRTAPTSPLGLLVLGWGFVGAPLVEELLFRGFLLPPLVRRLGPRLAVAADALLFGAMHASDPQAILPLVGLGVLLCALRLGSGSLWPAVALHATNNGVALLLVLSGLG
jgi:membrane protease YdiL (CAAX protease family)